MENYLKHEGVSYKVIVWRGNGWSAGCNSTIEAIDGPNKGQLYIADLGNGIYNLRLLEKDEQEAWAHSDKLMKRR